MSRVARASSPSSSPPSSPQTLASSSPPLSPVSEHHLDNDYFPILHPFSGYIKSTKLPPDYDRDKRENTKRAAASPPASPTQPKKFRTVNYDPPSPYTLSPDAARDQEAEEARIWDEKIEEMYNNSNGYLDLSDHGMTSIPNNVIDDLQRFFVTSDEQEATLCSDITLRSLKRTNTEPRNHDGSRSTFSRVASVSGRAAHFPRDKLSLNLSSNNLTSVPVSLCDLAKLTVLILRNNALTEIPPEIARLSNLQTLNIAQNRLVYLPAEMMQMSIERLVVIPNPFIQPTSPSFLTSARQVSTFTHLFPRVISLFELCLRKLLSPSSIGGPLMLRQAYETPLECQDPVPPPDKKRFRHRIPPAIHSVLDACDPGSVYVDEEEPIGHQAGRSDYFEVTGIGKCPNPLHDSKVSPGAGIFVMHAEEAFSWESCVAGCRIGEAIPVKWRGCSRGCLDFLVPHSDGDERDIGVSEDDDVVQFLPLSTGGFTEDDFGDE
ncbi:hypothetical protein C8J56DRAFT_25705 [Mycena floridula]|nr:hypothetical protein C8J56DRAFT_25705 [Mycena floridula]